VSVATEHSFGALTLVFDWREQPPFWFVGLLLRKCETDKGRTMGSSHGATLYLLLYCYITAPVSATASATFGVFYGLQVTDFDGFLSFFMCHFILLSCLGLLFLLCQ